MKVIDAINKINKEEKFRFRLLCDGDVYKYIGGSLYNETVGMRAEWIIDNKWLNEEIEILEEEKKIPEKLDHLIGYDIQPFDDLKVDDLKEYVEITTNDLFGKVNKVIDTLNQVIDYLKSKGE